jgi:hypothetical protein
VEQLKREHRRLIGLGGSTATTPQRIHLHLETGSFIPPEVYVKREIERTPKLCTLFSTYDNFGAAQ